jgi:hypothetical protein
VPNTTAAFGPLIVRKLADIQTCRG